MEVYIKSRWRELAARALVTYFHASLCCISTSYKLALACATTVGASYSLALALALIDVDSRGFDGHAAAARDLDSSGFQRRFIAVFVFDGDSRVAQDDFVIIGIF